MIKNLNDNVLKQTISFLDIEDYKSLRLSNKLFSNLEKFKFEKLTIINNLIKENRNKQKINPWCIPLYRIRVKNNKRILDYYYDYDLEEISLLKNPIIINFEENEIKFFIDNYTDNEFEVEVILESVEEVVDVLFISKRIPVFI